MSGKETTTLPPGTKVPKHLAIIPDGNRRWARARGFPTFEGHRQGFNRVVPLVRTARDFGIHTLTLWAFSTENWNRSKEEISYLMKLYEKMIEENLEEAKKEESRIIHLGRKERIPESLRKKIEKAEAETKSFRRYILNIALDYGGHDELLRAVEKIINEVKAGYLTPRGIWQEVGKYNGKYPYFYLKHYLDTGDQPYPYPDFIIRTSGEQRLSGLYCWQAAYSEIYFEKDHFPDFTPEKLRDAILDFSRRSRRFGGNG